MNQKMKGKDMPTPLLIRNMLQQERREDSLNITKSQKPCHQNDNRKLEIDHLLRQARSKAYMDAVRGLDAGGHVHNQTYVNNIIQAIQQEFPPEVINKNKVEEQEKSRPGFRKINGKVKSQIPVFTSPSVLLGYVAPCYLGKPYEVHTLDISGAVITHYKSNQTLPEGLEKARSIAMSKSYEFIEVYTDCFRAIDKRGKVSVIPNC